MGPLGEFSRPNLLAVIHLHVEHVMGMAVSIDIRDDRSPTEIAPAIADLVAWLHHVDAVFSTYKSESPISQFGLGELELADLSAEVLNVLGLCQELFEDTNGAFDAFAVPAPNGSSFDPSGVVKGWSVERGAEILERHGCRDFCINAGGDIALRGRPEPDAEWRIGIRHPEHAHLSAVVVGGSGRLAVATSGTYERGAHIIDPVTCEPTADVASVTIVGADLTFADAYATAVFVMGVSGLDWLVERHPDYSGFVITHQQTTVSTPGFPIR